MSTARVIQTHEGQMIELSSEFAIDGNSVEIVRQGDSILLTPVRQSWQPLLESLSKFTEDFLAEGRPQQPQQNRESFFH